LSWRVHATPHAGSCGASPRSPQRTREVDRRHLTPSQRRAAPARLDRRVNGNPGLVPGWTATGAGSRALELAGVTAGTGSRGAPSCATPTAGTGILRDNAMALVSDDSVALRGGARSGTRGSEHARPRRDTDAGDVG
jgi:hypothetical protein